MSTVGIVGGGPAGLALAHDLSQRGFQVTVFESKSCWGGLASSFDFGDIQIERYYHFICADDMGYFRKLEALGISEHLNWLRTRMGFFYNGKLYPFSSGFDLLKFGGISIAGRLRYGLLVLFCSILNHWQRLDGISAEVWLKRYVGDATYLATWYPLLKVKFNQYYNQISAAWIWHRIHRVARSRKTPLHPEMLGYLQGGTETLIGELVAQSQRLGASLFLNRAVTRVLIKDNRAIGLQTADGQQWNFDYIISTVALPIFLDLTPDLPEDYRSRLSGIQFIGVICLILRLRHPITRNYWLNINDPRISFNGCIEYTNLNPQATPDETSILYVPYYLPWDNERFAHSDEDLLEECVASLKVINESFETDWILDYAVSRDQFAQVICRAGFAQHVPEHITPIENLYLVESSQLYPSDRTISGMIDLARNVTSLLMQD